MQLRGGGQLSPGHLGSPRVMSPAGSPVAEPPPFQPTLPLLLCELVPEAQPLWAGPGAKECGRTQKLLSLCPTSQPSQVNWHLARANSSWRRMTCFTGASPTPAPPFCRWSNRVQRGKDGQGQAADEHLLPAPFCCHSGSSQLSSAKSRAWGGCLGKWLRAERLPWRCCRMLS